MLQAIVQAANDKDYSLRANLDVYIAANGRIVPISNANNSTDQQHSEPIFTSIRKLLCSGQEDDLSEMLAEGEEEEVILKKDFQDFVREDLGL